MSPAGTAEVRTCPNWFSKRPRFSNRPFLARTLSFLSSRPGFPATLRWTRLRLRLSRKERRMKFGQRHQSQQEIREERSERICGAPFECPAPTGPQSPQIIPDHPGKTNLPVVIPGFQEWSAEPQIPPQHAGTGRLRSPGFRVQIGGGCGPVGAGHSNGAPQIRSLRSG